MKMKFTRTLTTTKITCAKIYYEKDDIKIAELEPIMISGKISPDKAQKECCKLVEDQMKEGEALIIKSIEYTNAKYEMSLEIFLKYATLLPNESAADKK